jgi:uncharacterized protein YndB with AHSA1/START domain
MNNLTIAPIKKEVLVAASQETAFKVFTSKMDVWWPRTHHVGMAPMVDFVLEPHVNGRWYTRHDDGSEVNIGYVLVWDPYGRVILNWQVNANFKCDPNVNTEIEVQFIPQDPAKTLVKLEHRNLERLGSGEKTVEDMDRGWSMILGRYKDSINK